MPAEMRILLEDISKKFQRHWIFKNISYSFAPGGSYALLGANGSGKSTLLRIIAGIQTPSKGKVIHQLAEGSNLDATAVFPHIAFCAPGMELVEEFTLKEFLDFQFSFKKPLQGLTTDSVIQTIGLYDSRNKPIADYSSGMKQRVKLAQAIFSDTPVLLLDEPCSNLDAAGVAQYTEWISRYAANRLTIVASNDPREYFFCKEMLEVEQYK